MPDISHVAREQCPGLTPVRTVIIQHLAGPPCRGCPHFVAPCRVIIDAIGWIGHHQQRFHRAQHPLNIGGDRRVAAEQTVVPEDPEIAWSADRFLRRFRDLVLSVVRIGVVQGPGQ